MLKLRQTAPPRYRYCKILRELLADHYLYRVELSSSAQMIKCMKPETDMLSVVAESLLTNPSAMRHM